MPEEKKVRRKKKKKKKKKDPRKLEILDACMALGDACNRVRDIDDAMKYKERALKGYEEQLGRNSENALHVTYSLTWSTLMSNDEKIEKLRDLVKRMERALGEENVVTLDTLNSLGGTLHKNEEHEEAKEVWEKCLVGQTKLHGEDHRLTLMTMGNLGAVYFALKSEKALEYYERALKRSEKLMGKNHPDTLSTMMNTAIFYDNNLKNYVKAEELYERALEGYEAQFGKDHKSTKDCVKKFKKHLIFHNSERLNQLNAIYP
ncbi:hypothetical protein TL16_g00253 [Triparma laevis f. inornata]|uniref:Kinesin light chain n=1 Tax=Triparma laevis f. inornata TaxID=1714386 RepID=A0A9W7DM99_9STRA|nr:hypothetical protein TL16_g00253 [Triparma laevis f. inornata]